MPNLNLNINEDSELHTFKLEFNNFDKIFKSKEFIQIFKLLDLIFKAEGPKPQHNA